MDTGEENWLLEGVYPSYIFKKGRIYEDVEKAYVAYIEMNAKAKQQQKLLTRFAMGM